MPDGPPPAPAVQRIRLRYTKRGRLRFASHRDFQRAFERALRRARVPVAYSAGFTPHPRVSYANAAPTGVASEAEYLEIALVEERIPAQLRALLDASLPDGMEVLEAVEARSTGFAERLQASVWQVRLGGVGQAEADQAVRRFLDAPAVKVERLAKNGLRTFDARGPVITLQVVDSLPTSGESTARRNERDPKNYVTYIEQNFDITARRGCAILRLVVRHVTPAVRPDDVLSGLCAVAELTLPVPAEVTRLAQGPLDEEFGTVADPLEPDRGAATAVSLAVPGSPAAPAPVSTA
jgi:radical SAM-linked protein